MVKPLKTNTKKSKIFFSETNKNPLFMQSILGNGMGDTFIDQK